MKFNPKVKEFLEENPNQTMLGLSWSLYWRLYSVILGIAVIIALLSEI
jgi:hypothetical protein